MPTGFDKFRKKTLEESPIRINMPSDFNEESQERAQAERQEKAKQYSRRQSAVSGPEAAERRTKAKKEGERSLVNFMAQISPETKSKIDEMRFRLKKKNWELVDEAVQNLYDKYFKS